MANILSISAQSPQELREQIAQQAKACRLELNLTQEGLARRSGVSLGTLKRFEHTGHISLESLLKLAVSLSQLEPFELVFKSPLKQDNLSLDDILQDKPTRKKGWLK